ncbi:toll/interleukin-1 receptor domain-containing protein [Demequina sp. NBRC 110053]|uniref:toll/interleukin-1 receptor domain-containing protein n=1 Tax=Demequina sp. NBRC 110053 TaxID=1570342 RepID=UPI0013566B2D|nr:toll/interleukin-1 receptor domain-containing protein [Demequina sp. NBRC 110053]
MTAKRYFISHATPDKGLAESLRTALHGDAWVDLHELDVGDMLLEEIVDGIQAASDFVLLWSAAASDSRWVQYEFNTAFAKYINDNSVAIRIYRLDDTEVPLKFQAFLYGDGTSGADAIAASLGGHEARARSRRAFFDRAESVGEIEAAVYSPNVKVIVLAGVAGVGKRSLAREALTRLTAGSGAALAISAGPGVREVELDLLLSRSLRVPAVDEGASPEAVNEHLLGLVRAHTGSGGFLVLEEIQHWLLESGEPGPLLTTLLDAIAISAMPENAVLMTSRRRPRLGSGYPHVRVSFIDGLPALFGVPLLRHAGARGGDEELAEVVEALQGHPLALEVVAPKLPLEASALVEQRIKIATDLVDPAALTVGTWRALEALAPIDGPVRAEVLAECVGVASQEMQRIVDEAIGHALLTWGSGGTLALHPLMRDYFLRSMRKDPAHRRRLDHMASVVYTEFERLGPDNALYVTTMVSCVKLLGLAGRFEEAVAIRRDLRGVLLETATELYHEKRYGELLPYLEEAVTDRDELDLEVLRLKAKTLAHLNRIDDARALIASLIRRWPTHAGVLRDAGRVELIARNWDAAISYFQRAIPFRRDPAQLWSDIAQARSRKQDWAGAAEAARTSIDLGGDTPWTLATYSQALENQGEFMEAEAMIQKAVTREPLNPGYRHRLGRIALQLGKFDRAIAEFRRSTEIDPSFHESWLSLASALADTSDLDGAEAAVERARSLPGTPRAIVGNLRAKVALQRDRFDDATRYIDEALSDRRDVHNLTLAIRIAVARGDQGLISAGQAAARVRTLAQELDTMGELAAVLDLAESHPEYFEH